jgi:hypothetical protein
MEPPVKWERFAEDWYSCQFGYVRREEGSWAAYVLRNRRVGVGWTERRAGFRTRDWAMRWVEREAED